MAALHRPLYKVSFHGASKGGGLLTGGSSPPGYLRPCLVEMVKLFGSTFFAFLQLPVHVSYSYCVGLKLL